jgi:hypothetical protein
MASIRSVVNVAIPHDAASDSQEARRGSRFFGRHFFPLVALLQNRRGSLLEPLAAGGPHAVEPPVLAAVNRDRGDGLPVFRAEEPPGILDSSAQPFADLIRAIFDSDDQSAS